MSLLLPGYWQREYWPQQYWQEDYWQNFGIAVGGEVLSFESKIKLIINGRSKI